MMRLFLRGLLHSSDECLCPSGRWLGVAALSLFIITLLSSCYPYSSSHQVTPFNSPRSQLEEQYSIYLDATWTPKQAQALLKVFGSVPAVMNLPFSTWKLSDDDLENGIKIESKDKIKFVTLSRDIFPIEGSQAALSPEKHLYYAVVQFITENGTNRSVIELILQKRYGIYVPSYASLAEGVPNNTSKRYSDFENDDLMLIISVFEAFPQALHKIPQLKYIVRRIDTEERGISTAIIGRGRIEFAESIFRRPHFHDFFHRNTQRIVAHEKAHFLWAYVFNKQLKAEWAQLGGWHPDSTSESGWATTQERSTFVSEYASEKNPDEDMAESIAHYLISPDRLRSCCPAKYEFIHNRIMLLYAKRWAAPNAMSTDVNSP